MLEEMPMLGHRQSEIERSMLGSTSFLLSILVQSGTLIYRTVPLTWKVSLPFYHTGHTFGCHIVQCEP